MNEDNASFNHPDPNVRCRTLEVLAGAKMADVDGILAEAILDPVAEVGQRACDILAFRHPWLVLDSSGTRPVPLFTSRRYRYGAPWRSLRAGLAEMVRALPPGKAIPGDLFKHIPGLIPELTEELQTAGRADEAARLIRSTNAHRDRDRTRRQIMMAPTYGCNLSCPYCYIKGWGGRFRGHMPLKAFCTALRWGVRQGVNWVILGGGEPTVHPSFGELVREAYRAGMQISLTSNGLFGPDVRRHIKPPQVPAFICHVEQDILLHDPRRAAIMRENLAAITASGVDVRIRYTLTSRSDHREREAILSVAREFDVRIVNYGFAFRNMDGSNESFAYENGAKVSFNKTLNRFMDEARQACVMLQLCKPFPLCEVTLPTLRRVAREGGLRTSCLAYQRNYSKNLTINPDLTTLPCNALGQPGPLITEFMDFHEAGRYYETFFRGLYEQPWRPKCARCILHYRGFCHGACLAEHFAARPAHVGWKGESL